MSASQTVFGVGLWNFCSSRFGPSRQIACPLPAAQTQYVWERAMEGFNLWLLSVVIGFLRVGKSGDTLFYIIIMATRRSETTSSAARRSPSR